MVRYRRDLYRLLRNFVNFADFYDPRRPAVFQAGTLYLDGRACHLCVKVDDPAAHAGHRRPQPDVHRLLRLQAARRRGHEDRRLRHPG